MLGALARASLMEVLQKEGLKVALPIGGRDMDMLVALEFHATPCMGVPLKIVAVDADALSSHMMSVPATGLLVALVWEIADPAAVRTFALTAAELIVVRMRALMGRDAPPRRSEGEERAHTARRIIQSAIAPFSISPGQWRKKLQTMLEGRAHSGV